MALGSPAYVRACAVASGVMVLCFAVGRYLPHSFGQAEETASGDDAPRVALLPMDDLAAPMEELAAPMEEPAEPNVLTDANPFDRPLPAEPEHPLLPVLRLAQTHCERLLAEVDDYTCKMLKRERISGKLRPRELMELKVRHAKLQADGSRVPFSVYAKYLAPASLKGREVLYVEGENEGRLVATKGGGGLLSGLTLSLAPDSGRAMEGNRYPITDIGVLNIAKRIADEAAAGIEIVAELDSWRVEPPAIAKINGRAAKCIHVSCLQRRPDCSVHTLRLFVDEELQVPVRFAAFEWQAEDESAPRLAEEYTYLDMKLNVGLTDDDFSRDHPDYGFAAFDVPGS